MGCSRVGLPKKALTGVPQSSERLRRQSPCCTGQVISIRCPQSKQNRAVDSFSSGNGAAHWRTPTCGATNGEGRPYRRDVGILAERSARRGSGNRAG